MMLWKDACAEAKENLRAYQPAPFWSWNDALEDGELRLQIQEQDEKGIGGFFMHARGGLRTPYMQEAWMQAIRVCIDEAAKRGMKSWLYDEQGWPSGFAGGAVPKLGEWYQQKHLCCSEGLPGEEAGGCVIGRYLPREGYRMLRTDETPDGQPVMTVYYTVNPYYVDLMKEEAVKAFIDAAYEPYYREFGQFFGKEIPGIFTDEPQLAFARTAWSEILPDRFFEKYGYPLLPSLPLLFVKAEGWERLRYDFWALQGELFETAFTRQIAAWCAGHGLALTGHYLFEDDLRGQTLTCGGAMRHYRHMDIPGMDWLWGNTGKTPMTILQVASSAAQAGKKRVISEMFGGTGWQMPLRQMRANAEWQLLYGVNLICTHLQAYSIRGDRKEDWPPSVFYQNPQWPKIQTMYRDLTELCALFANGEKVANVLLVHPLKSAYIAVDGRCTRERGNPDIDALEEAFEAMALRLIREGIGFHLGDEEDIKNAFVDGEGCLHIGPCSYRCAVIPSCLTLDEATVGLLLQMIERGGAVFAQRQGLPYLLNGRPDAQGKLRTLFERCALIEKEGPLPAPLRGACGQRALWAEPVRQLHLGVYAYADGEALFVLNGGDGPESADIRFPGPAAVRRLRPAAGEYAVLDTLSVTLAPGESALYFAKSEIGEVCERESPVLSPYARWQPERRENILRCGLCSYSVEGGPWSAPMRPHQARACLLKLERSADIRLKYTFEADAIPGGEIFLVVEKETFDAIRINRQPLPAQDAGWWMDRAFRRIRMTGRIRTGMNEILIEKRFSNSPEMAAWLRRAEKYEAEKNMLTYETEIEAVYVMGEFGVYWRGDGYAIGPWPERVDIRNLAGEGFPYLCGDLTLSKTVMLRDRARYSAILLELSSLDGGFLRIAVNGEEALASYCTPMRCNLLPYLREGENTVSATLTLTSANAMASAFAQKPRESEKVRFPSGTGNGLQITCYDAQGRII